MTGEGKKVLVVLGKIAPGTKGKIRVGLKFIDLPILIITLETNHLVMWYHIKKDFRSMVIACSFMLVLRFDYSVCNSRYN